MSQLVKADTQLVVLAKAKQMLAEARTFPRNATRARKHCVTNIDHCSWA